MKYKNKWIRSIALLLLATLLLGLVPSVFADDSPIVTHIQTADELVKLADNCRLDSWSQGRTVSLDADIALDGVDFSGIPTFGGTFQGNGHTISGLSFTGKDSFAGLFRTVQETGTIENLNVSGEINVTGGEAVGGIAAVNYGTITGCSFSGSISGDTCVGGIAGRSCGYIVSCQNSGVIYGRKDIGGVAGLTSGTIWSNLSKGTLSGKSYVGGIVGSGVAQDLTGASSTVTGCCSMVKIQDDPQYMGAVSAANKGSFLWNYFVSDELAGIDGQSYAGKAEPTTFQKMIATDGVPEEMKTLHLTFVADDALLSEQTFDYGDSLAEDIYPEIPEKDGYFAQWNITDLSNLHFDIVVTAVYTPYTTAIPTDAKTQDGAPVFLAEGDFDGEVTLEAEMSQKDTEAFHPLSSGLTDAVSHYLSSTVWYRLPTTPIHQDVVEQWTLTVPADGKSEH